MLRFFLLSNKICVIPCVHVCLNKDVSVIELICLQGREVGGVASQNMVKLLCLLVPEENILLYKLLHYFNAIYQFNNINLRRKT